MAAKRLFAVNFEVFGLVQGVFFRKHTVQRAKGLGLKGWCMNTANGTVKGQLEVWLETKGSPSSRIDKAVFSEMKSIEKYSFTDFEVRH
uniref:acylphosphatase n=1 Tax=Glossina morsitans morsitans TaxID=37546 RepID=A0ABK9NFX0_GLOMM